MQGLLRVQGRPAVSYDDQGMVFTIAYKGFVRMFDARKYEKVKSFSFGENKVFLCLYNGFADFDHLI